MKSLLIANRGEIACRVIRTARRMGVRSIAIYSDSDRNALHVREADEAVHIGPSPARESYLVGERIIAAAKATGAEAIHPGYGFLSENADFAEAVIEAGLVWVGPRPESIRAMGLKDAAKALMTKAGVPVTPGYLGEDQDPGRLEAEAEAIGWPVLIKAVAGGGGKGMRRVDSAAEFQEMLASCKREAASSFGDDKVLIEKYIERPRHIEVQVFGDSHGNVVHLFERDCSLQRRHQKVIEEAPAPGMDEATRAAVCGAAVKAARAVDYVGAGTIEFIADSSEGLRADRIWFMEMNTRLQVEHPVTEAITGQDLVEWQLLVASGEPLPRRQKELFIDGWAIEARLYAENPATGFLPSTGRIEAATLYGAGWGQRVDAGVAEGDLVSPHYDPMIAKLIAHDDTRDNAIRKLEVMLGENYVWPVKTNAAFLARCLGRREFRSGRVDTGLIARRVDELTAIDPIAPAALALAAERIVGQTVQEVGVDQRWPVLDLGGFRLNAEPCRRLTLFVDGEPVEAQWSFDRPPEFRAATARPLANGDLLLVEAGLARHVSTRPPAAGAGSAAVDGAVVSPMPGKIIAVAVRPGETVAKGDRLVTLEAMKMEHSLAAPFDGIVAEVNAAEGGQVSEGALLVRIERDSSDG